SEGEAAYTERNIFGLITVDDDGSSITVTVEGYSVDGTTETLEQSMTFVAGTSPVDLAAEVAREVDVAYDAAFVVEPAIVCDLALEVDRAFEAILAADPALQAELAREVDQGFEA